MTITTSTNTVYCLWEDDNLTMFFGQSLIGANYLMQISVH